MFAHVTLHASDPDASRAFYATVLDAMGGAGPRGELRIEAATAEHPVTRGLHLGFGARSPQLVDAFWHAGIAAGAVDDGEPGPRPQYLADYYGGFLLDPDGNSAEAVHHGEVRPDGLVDHLWVRVPDLAAARAFYRGLTPRIGWTSGNDDAQRISFNAASGSISFVAGDPATEHLHVGLLATQATGAPLRDPAGNVVELVAAASEDG
jgi:catechol 2,3-dioxygenase-like lactoylglutathione lyase family enzyme